MVSSSTPPDTSRARAHVCRHCADREVIGEGRYLPCPFCYNRPPDGPKAAEPLTIVDHGPDNFWVGAAFGGICGVLGSIVAVALHGWLA